MNPGIILTFNYLVNLNLMKRKDKFIGELQLKRKFLVVQSLLEYFAIQ